jgi:rhomboid protease GluP
VRRVFARQTTGSVVCPSCGKLVAVRDDRCWSCGRRNPGMWGFGPALRKLGQDLGFGRLTLGLCLLFYGLSLALFPQEIDLRIGFGFLSPGPIPLQVFGASGGHPVFGLGWWWTVASACWMHGGLLHLAFNMYWLTQLAPALAHLYGPGRAVMLYFGSSVVGFTATSVAFRLQLPSFLHGAELTIGASAALFGWMGALVYYGRRTGSTRLTQQMLGFVLPMFVLGLLVPMVDNWAHLGGFAGGYVLGKLLDPLKPERVDHVVGALVALALSLVAVAASIFSAWPHLR